MNENRRRLYSAIKIMCTAFLLVGFLSCNKRTERKLTDTGWRSVERTVENDLETSTEGVDSFNHILKFNSDGTFYRTFETGTWVIEGNNLMVTSYEGTCKRTYDIVKCTNRKLILEIKQSASDSFIGCADVVDSNPIITEEYERSE
ncbi:MAG: hypothetical protein ACI8ZM_002416 [Crocinitomix sp.]|jgi:hypothetical protein